MSLRRANFWIITLIATLILSSRKSLVVVKFRFIILWLLFGEFFSPELFAQNYFIPEQQIYPHRLMGMEEVPIKIRVNSFEISKQVTLKEYKNYLSVIKKDSGEIAYLNRLPDSSIGPKNIYEKYFNSGEYDDFPIVGVSWDNALRYCKWLTLKNNTGDTLNVIYRLPNLYEYLSANDYLNAQKIANDLDTLYSDWLMDTYEEDFQVNQNSFQFGYYYFHLNEDMLVQKRKIVMGQSFLYRFIELKDYNFSYYAPEGYRHIGFRIITDKHQKSFEKTTKKTYRNKDGTLYYDNPLLQYWNLKPIPKK